MRIICGLLYLSLFWWLFELDWCHDSIRKWLQKEQKQFLGDGADGMIRVTGASPVTNPPSAFLFSGYVRVWGCVRLEFAYPHPFFAWIFRVENSNQHVQFKLRWLEVHRNCCIFDAAMFFDIPYISLRYPKNLKTVHRNSQGQTSNSKKPRIYKQGFTRVQEQGNKTTRIFCSPLDHLRHHPSFGFCTLASKELGKNSPLCWSSLLLCIFWIFVPKWVI